MNQQTIKIAAVGDIMLDRKVGQRYLDDPDSIPLSDVANILNQYDLVIGNLENPCGLTGKPYPKQDPHVAFRCHPDTLSILPKLNVGVVSLGNNHMLDYGPGVLDETLHHLKKNNIRYLGAGENRAQANQPLLLEINRKKIAIIASTMIFSASTEAAKTNSAGVADYHVKRILKSVQELRGKGYFVIVTIHWGIEYCFYPIPYQREHAMKMIDAGASLILGHGPHFPQGIERYKHGEIVHSLGNFIFDEPYLHSRQSFIYGVEIPANEANTPIKNSVHPVVLDQYFPKPDPRGEKSTAAIIANHFGRVYQRKSKGHWKKINNRWFSDIAWRVTSMRSLKFVFLPPIRFWFSLGFDSYSKKINLNNMGWLLVQLKKMLGKSDSNRTSNAQD